MAMGILGGAYQMNAPLYKIGDVVQYNRVFWDYYEDPENGAWLLEVVDSPMIILKSSMTPAGDKSHNYVRYTILQGDQQLSISEDDVELIK